MIENIINKQRAYFNSGVTLDYNVRINALKQLKSELIKNKDFRTKYHQMSINIHLIRK